MNLRQLVAHAADKRNFVSLDQYIDFACRFLDFACDERNLQAVIVSQNETNYRFFQYKQDGAFNITRPINFSLYITAAESHRLAKEFLNTFDNAQKVLEIDAASRSLLCNGIYTIQQSIGAALDGLPAGRSNNARKINGDLFERLIRLLIQRLDINCMGGNINVPIELDNGDRFTMSYQHDLIVKVGEVVKLIGGVKTSSKDRLDKIFIDKFLYCKLTDTQIPHIAIFLNDVQRKRTRKTNSYGVSATFLPGHFKGYSIKLSPLDGVYYCDIRPNMSSDPLLRKHIRTIDHFFCSDIWRFLASA